MSAYSRKPKPCEWCGAEILVMPSRWNRTRFCSRSCQGHSKVEHLNAARKPATANPTWFQVGSEPWNKGVSVRLSPDTEFKRGCLPANHLPVGTTRIRNDKNGKPRAYIKTAEPNVWKLRSVLNWESTHGPVPKGFLVHHKDRDTLNDSPRNLGLLNRGQHLLEHRSDFEQKRKIAAASAKRQRTVKTLP